MTKRSIVALAAVATLLAVAIGAITFMPNEAPAPKATSTVEQGADVQPAADVAPKATEQVPQYNKEGFIPPPSDATGSSSPEGVAPKKR